MLLSAVPDSFAPRGICVILFWPRRGQHSSPGDSMTLEPLSFFHRLDRPRRLWPAGKRIHLPSSESEIRNPGSHSSCARGPVVWPWAGHFSFGDLGFLMQCEGGWVVPERLLIYLSLQRTGFPCGSAGKEFAYHEGDLGSILRLGRSPGEGKGYPLQYSCLENSMDCIAQGGSLKVRHDWVTLTSLHFREQSLDFMPGPTAHHPFSPSMRGRC